jgi:hypothetical protein
MSYTELEHGYQGLRRARPAFCIGVDGNGCPAVRAAKNRVSKLMCTLHDMLFDHSYARRWNLFHVRCHTRDENNIKKKYLYNMTPIIQINWDRKQSRYAENLDNWIFL